MSIFKSIGKALGGIMKTAAPFAGLIPGVGPLAAAGLGAGGNFLGNALQGNKANLGSALLSGASAGAGSALTKGQGFKGFGNLGGQGGTLAKLGTALKKPGLLGSTQPGGGFDLGKIGMVGMAGANLLGNNAQRKSAQARMNADTDLRNQLMSQTLTGSTPIQY